jgi:hypothetical protein
LAVDGDQVSEMLEAVVGAYATAVFMVVPIDDVVAAFLDAPVASVQGKKTLEIRLFWGSLFWHNERRREPRFGVRY